MKYGCLLAFPFCLQESLLKVTCFFSGVLHIAFEVTRKERKQQCRYLTISRMMEFHSQKKQIYDHWELILCRFCSIWREESANTIRKQLWTSTRFVGSRFLVAFFQVLLKIIPHFDAYPFLLIRFYGLLYSGRRYSWTSCYRSSSVRPLTYTRTNVYSYTELVHSYICFATNKMLITFIGSHPHLIKNPISTILVLLLWRIWQCIPFSSHKF